MASTETKNQRFYTTPEGEEVVSLSFVSEPLGLPGANGYGWARFQVEQKIGPKQSPERYTILRKLGWGGQSSTWLVRDSEASGDENCYVAVKALNGHGTELDRQNLVWEQDALRLLGYQPRSPHCIYSTATFTVPGVGTSGDHLCMVMPLMGGDLGRFLDAQPGRLPYPLAKHIIVHFLRGLAHAHSRGVVHTDLKATNIFFESRLTTSDIDAWLENTPAQLHDPEISPDGIVRSYLSQPLPVISAEEAMSTAFMLADFGSALPSTLHDNRVITMPALRAPEVHLGGTWDLPADIWAFGIIVYNTVVNGPLYRYVPHPEDGLDELQHLLRQMQTYSAEGGFRAKLLQRCALAPEYFNADCTLKTGNMDFVPYASLILKSGALKFSEAHAMDLFLQRCMNLVPEERATAEELLQDPWIVGM